jgi:regulator of nucleoside diphosphate kinase
MPAAPVLIQVKAGGLPNEVTESRRQPDQLATTCKPWFGVHRATLRARGYLNCVEMRAPDPKSLPLFFLETDVSVTPHIVVSKQDVVRLEALLASVDAERGEVARALAIELDRAEHRDRDAMPDGVVMMGSHVRCIDETTGEQYTFKLVYPGDADFAEGRVSILAPVGAALLGLSVGQTIQWPLPGGRETRLTVVSVTND